MPAVDLTGDGVPDVVLFLADSSARGITVLDGATGQPLWSATS